MMLWDGRVWLYNIFFFPKTYQNTEYGDLLRISIYFIIYFTLLCFVKIGKKNVYKIMTEGLDKVWIDCVVKKTIEFKANKNKKIIQIF